VSDQTIKVLHFSSRYEECGVAKYLGHYIKGMAEVPEIENEYFEVSPYETYNMKPADLDDMEKKLLEKLRNFDVLHVQHEFALYAHDSFRRVIMAGNKSGKKVVVTVHISPSLHGASKKPRLHGFGPHSLLHYLKESKHHNQFVREYVEPMKKADLILVHNDVTAQGLEQLGISADSIRKHIHPVQVYPEPKPTTDIATHLNRQKGDVIFCIIGFFHRQKGVIEAVKALKFLPENYKLAILGGMKADSDDIEYYDRVCDLIDKVGVQDRIYITGYVPSDDTLNAYIRECDVCVYPFNRTYYAAVSSGSVNLAFFNGMPAIAYPTEAIKELAIDADGAVVVTETFAYYELARELLGIDLAKQRDLSKAYAKKAAWPKVSKQLVEIYAEVLGRN
jgi:glycosyltransferase involved in cell wall biosynthesis